MNEISSDLIYDIGFHDGSDTAYYLRRGYRVVAVDANPNQIRQGEALFRDAVQSGRLVLVHGAIAPTDATDTVRFYISAQSEWSSVVPSIAGRDGVDVLAVDVPVVSISDLVALRGVPHYMKIDIEGMDDVVLGDLASLQARPTYVSVEAEGADDSGSTDEEGLRKLGVLAQLGYRRFKLVDQDSLRVLSPINFSLGPRRGVYERARRQIGLRPRQRQHVVRLAGRRVTFPFGSSGPFGKDLAGEWIDEDAARELLVRTRHAYFEREDARSYGFWCDWHATV